tara:strand:- start:15 stop:758 length:744 start_codon:yes stop_codon:yes gene_type:complete
MDTAFIIGNGESRNIFPIEDLKGKGIIYGCNAIYRDHPKLCDHIVSVNPAMFEELAKWHNNGKESPKIHGLTDISDWNYICDGDKPNDTPKGLKIYRIWRGGNLKKQGRVKTEDFTVNRGSGCSAVLMAAESGVKNVIILSFDILGSRQWEMHEPSRIQNNIYKNSVNYPDRHSMKAYLKYEWMFQLRQIFRKFPDTNFYFINRREYLHGNNFLRWYFDQPNINCGIYADLQRWVSGKRDEIKWLVL